MNNQIKSKEQQIVDLQNISFKDIFNLSDVQYLQDLFADAHGVASLISDPEGNPITQPSNFTRLCKDIIRKTEKGCTNCFHSDSVIGRHNPAGAVVQTCLSGGLWDAGASITVGGRHIANWLIGQVRNEQVDEQQMILYAEEIGADKEEFKVALNEVPVMAAEKFQKIANLLFAFAKELSEKAFTNLQLNAQIIEKERANTLLHEHEENLSTTLNSIGDGVISTDKNGLIIQMNPVAEDLCGWALEDAVGRPLHEVFCIVNAETRQIVADPVKKVLEGGGIVGLANHTVLISKKGTEYQIADSAAPIKNKEGKVTGVVLVFSDVTETYLAQKRIKEREELYHNLLNNLEAGIIVHAADTSIVMNNPRASELLGLTDEQLRGKAVIDPAWRFVTEDNTPLPLEEYPVNRIIRNRNVIKNQILGSFHPGKNSVVWATVNGFPVTDSKGEITQIVISFIDITKRKMEEIARIESDALFKHVFNNSNVGKSITSPSGEIKVNKAFCNLLGYNEEELHHKKWQEITHPDDLELSLQEITRIRNREVDKVRFNKRFLHKNGSIVWVDLNSSVLINKEGELQLITTLIDITDRIQAEENLRRSENELKKAQQITHIGSWYLDLATNGVTWTEELYKMYGFNPNLPPPPYTEHKKLFTTESWELLSSSLAHTSETGIPYELELKTVREDGSNGWVWVRGETVKNSDGQTIGLWGAAQDISERKHLEKIREIQYNIATAVVTSDSLDQLLEFVRSELSQVFDTTNFFAALYNDRNHTLKKLHWVDEIDEFTEWDVDKSFSGYVLKTGKSLLMNKQEIAILGAEQNIPIVGTPAECWLGVPMIVNKKPIGVLVIQSYTNTKAYDASSAMLFGQVAYDLSIYIEKTRILQDLNIAKNHAEESDRLKSAFLANMSHEIRTPMNGILGFAEVLKDPNLSGEKQKEYINIIGKSGTRMLNIINDIIDISKIESGLMNVKVKESNINEQIEYIYTFFKPEVEAKGMRLFIKTSLPTKEAIIQTDREKLYAILTNLVKNAIKYSTSGSIEFGYTVVETEHPTLLQFYVSDSGIGIPKDRQTAIFERFIQAEITDKMARQGAGLGLSISKAYVEMLGGKIWVESEEGKGATFYFTLPYDVERKEETLSDNWLSDLTSDPEERLKILIAEDDETSEILLELAIKGFSKEIIKVGSGSQAVESCRNNPDIDLILMDILMPEMSGYEAVRQIRQFNKKVVIIAQTAYGLSGDKEKSIESGCNDHIAKPIAKAELQAMLRKYFGKKL